jgi:transporter family protein
MKLSIEIAGKRLLCNVAFPILLPLVFPIASVFLLLLNKINKEVICWSAPGIVAVILSGAAATFGTVFFYFALAKSPASIVVVLTALYPAVTVLLAVLFLHEKINLCQGIGFILILIAIYLISR